MVPIDVKTHPSSTCYLSKNQLLHSETPSIGQFPSVREKTTVNANRIYNSEKIKNGVHLFICKILPDGFYHVSAKFPSRAAIEWIICMLFGAHIN